MLNIKVPAYGPRDTDIVLVGEAPGEHEESYSAGPRPFVGPSGQELDRMLHEASILRAECFTTNVSKFRPPNNDIEHFFLKKKEAAQRGVPELMGRYPLLPITSGLSELHDEIDSIRPNVIVAMGGTALWALTGHEGITLWRNSTLDSLPIKGRIYKVIPTFHPVVVLYQWSFRAIAVHDLKKVQREHSFPEIRRPEYDFILRPTLTDVAATHMFLMKKLEKGPCRLAVDLETRDEFIACVGIAWNRLSAICIPFMCTERKDGYWSETEEKIAREMVCEIIQHPNAEIIGQNFLYDAQYFAWEWKKAVLAKIDTMWQQHICFPSMPKALYFISSMYCRYHEYWKDEGKNWDKSIPEEKLWAYNCTDAVTTWEASQVLDGLIRKWNLGQQFAFQMSLFEPVLVMMLQGCRINTARRNEFTMEILEEVRKRDEWFVDVLGHQLNPRSHIQMKALFYDDFKMPKQFNRKARGSPVTLNDAALETIALKEPLMVPLVNRIQEHRSLGVYLSTFIRSKLEPDDRVRCSYNPAGTETFRFSSSKNAFGRGMNLQNTPRPDDDVHEDPEFKLPNIRTMFLPDEGDTLMDWDMRGADAQVVAWEADDDELKQIFREGADIHAENAKVIYGKHKVSPLERQFAKTFVHGTNYGGGTRTMAAHCNITVHQASRAQAAWFKAHPSIPAWHKRISMQLQTNRTVTSAFGYRRFYFDRIESLLPEALAWIPQNTVACIINRGLVNLYQNMKDEVDILLQVHDSLVLQVRTETINRLAPLIREQLLITVPYPDPLVIDVNCKIGPTWGDMTKMPLTQPQPVTASR